MRRAKIVCTLGPATSNIEVLRRMIEAGMDVARLNFSHGTFDDHKNMFDKIRTLSHEVGRPISILQDLQGPKIRVGKFKDGGVALANGSKFIITMEDYLGDEHKVSTTYKELADDVVPGDILLLDDGLLRFRVESVDGPEVTVIVEVGGILKNNKGINLPTAAVSSPSMTEKDIRDLKYGVELGVDYMALSFVRSPLDIHQLKAQLPKDSSIKIISKIEKPQGVKNLEAIIAVSDGIMIARGDLGVELPPEKVPVIQKRAIADANKQGKLSITATQMLDSMQDNPRPTRAEASDVANAILDGTDAVMLSGETATGDYPIESVQMMASIIEEIEGSPIYKSLPSLDFIDHLKTFPNAIAKAASVSADELDVLGITVLTQSGFTARLMMTYRPNKPIIVFTPDETVYNQLAAFWGVRAHLMSSLEMIIGKTEQIESTEMMIEKLENSMRKNYGAKTGDEIIIVFGFPMNSQTETNTLKFHRIGEKR